MQDLAALEGARTREVGSPSPALRGIHSPLTDHLSQWRGALAQHPDDQFRRYILGGIERGFRIGFDHSNLLVLKGICRQTLTSQP
jgi:hypothetical protein